MRRSICYCEPAYALAGETSTWKFIYTTATSLPKGTLLRFNLMSDGREIDWELPSVNPKKTSNLIYAKVKDGKHLYPKEIDTPDSYAPLYEFELPVKLEAGGEFTIVVGSPKLTGGASEKNGTRTQTYAQRRRPFLLYIDTTGKRHFEDPEVFSMDIRGGVLHHINVVGPSFVTRNKRFDVIVRFEDAFGNLTSNAPEDTLIELSHEHLRENLNWKIFVPETGFISLPNLYFNEEGIYTIQLKNTATGETFRSSPIKCFNDNANNLYWGLLHGESVRVDSTDSIENCLRHFRDEKCFNFFASSPFESAEETPNDIWKLISQNIADFDEAERFTTMLGIQWQGQSKSEGLRHFVFNKDNKQILRKKDAKNSGLKKIYKSFSPKEMISIPSLTMGKGMEFDFTEFDPDFERVVEIYNAWGSSERTKKEGNEKPIEGSGKNVITEASEGSIVKALLKNCRFGFVAGGLDDRGSYSDCYESEQEQYSPGMTAIIAPEHSRASLFDALYKRSCYATTGQRIIIGFNLSGVPMGAETSTMEKHGLNVNRHLSGFAAGTTKLKKVEIIRNGEVIHTYKPQDYHLHFEFDDLRPLVDVALDAKDKKAAFVFYYIRVTQEDGEMAWSSPIWVDYIPGKGPNIKRAKLPVKGKKQELLDLSAKSFAEDDEDDLDDDEDDV